MDPQETAAAPEPRREPLGALHTATVTLDGAGRVVTWSPGAFRILGYPAEEMVGRKLAGLLRDDPPEAVCRFLAGVGGRAVTTTFLVRDGRDLSVELIAPEAPDPGVGGTRLVVITPVREEQHDLLEWSFDQLPFMAGITDHELRFVRLNEKATAAFGSPEGGRLGATPTEQVGYPEGERTETAMRHAMETGKPTTLDTFVKLPNAERGEAWQGLYVPLKDPRGIPRGLYTVALDIGAQHLARQRLALLNQASSIGSTLDVKRTAEELTEVMTPGVADYVTVDLLESVLTDEEPEFRAPHHPVSMRRIAHRSVLKGAPEAALPAGDVKVYPVDGPHMQTLITGRPLVIPAGAGERSTDWSAFGEFRLAKAREYGLHSALILPIVARGALLGVASYVRHRTPDPFGSDDLLLAEEITARAAVVHRQRPPLHPRARDRPRRCSTACCPSACPRQAAVETASRYRPAGTRAGVGGDWFDVIPLSGARVALVVGDVVGHGVRAAAAMGRLRTAVRTLADVDLPPDELLTHLDDIVASQLTGESRGGRRVRRGRPGELGATCVYAIYDPVSRRCTLARAGHPPPALVSPGRNRHLPRRRPGRSTAGPGRAALRDRPRCELPEGSLLVLYTDGLVPERRPDIDDGLGAAAPGPGRRGRLAGGDLRRGAADDAGGAPRRRRRPVCWPAPTPWTPTRSPPGRSPPTPRWSPVPASSPAAARPTGAWRSVAFTTELVVSELVTNAIRYGAGPHPAAADPRHHTDLRGLGLQQHRSAPAPGPRLRRGRPRPAARRPAHPPLGHPAHPQGQDHLGRTVAAAPVRALRCGGAGGLNRGAGQGLVTACARNDRTATGPTRRRQHHRPRGTSSGRRDIGRLHRGLGSPSVHRGLGSRRPVSRTAGGPPQC